MEKNNIWQKLRNGDHLTDAELEIMIREARAAMPFLRANLPATYYVHKQTLLDIDTMEGYLRARGKLVA